MVHYPFLMGDRIALDYYGNRYEVAFYMHVLLL